MSKRILSEGESNVFILVYKTINADGSATNCHKVCETDREAQGFLSKLIIDCNRGKNDFKLSWYKGGPLALVVSNTDDTSVALKVFSHWAATKQEM